MAISKAAVARAKQSAIAAGFRAFRSTGAHKLAARWTGGIGAILMMHRVRPWTGDGFAPNRLLEITPEFLAETIETLRKNDFEIVSLDKAISRINGEERAAGRFAVLSFDDAYRDNLEHALPVLRRYEAPFVLYAVPGFAERSAGLWWVELEEAIRHSEHVELRAGGEVHSFDTSDIDKKNKYFNSLYWILRALPEGEMREHIRKLAEGAGVDWRSIVDEACMDWDAIQDIASDPLCTIGAHTLTHPMLAKIPADSMRLEMQQSREQLMEKLGKPVDHFAYPVGDPGSAGQREFDVAGELSFKSAVTTRPGMVFSDHSDFVHALPRLSVNGNWQDVRTLEVLLSGAPFALWNRGKRLNVA